MSTESPSVPLRLTGHERLVLTLLLGAQFMFALDFSIVTVALPAMGSELGIQDGNLQWIITLFALSAAGLVLLMGRIGDYYGRKKLFLIGMAILVIASMCGGIATDPAALYVARIGQGLATAITMPAALSLLTTSFEEGPLRNKALGLNGALLSLGFAVGAVLGGVLTDLFGWRFTFLINVPVGLVILAVAPFVIKDVAERVKQKLDVPGAITLTIGLLSLVLGVTSIEREGWQSLTTLGLLALAAVAAIAFWNIEARSPHPLAAVTILKRPTVSLGNLGGLVTFSMESGKVFLLTIYLQRVLDSSALATGLAFGVLGAGAFTGGIFAARIIDKISAKSTLVLGLVLQGVSTLSFLLLGMNSGIGFVHILIATSIGGFGHVLCIVSYTVAVTSGLPDSEQGLASGLAGQTQQVAFTIGTPIVSVLALSFTAANYTDPESAAAILGGVHFGLAIDAAIILAAAAIIVSILPKRTPTTDTTPLVVTDAP